MTELAELVAAELAESVDPRVADFAASIAEKYGKASRAVLFYGSCLRTSQLEGQMLDFYLIVSSYRAAYGKGWLARANAMLPPNVFPAQHGELAAKYAVLNETDFHALNRREASTVSVWARFAQPSRLAWVADEKARGTATKAICGAAPTLLNAALAHCGEDAIAPHALWEAGFALTYGAELRAERANRPGSVVDFAPQRYERFTAPALSLCPIANSLKNGHVKPLGSQPDKIEAERRRWPGLRRRGKLLTIARLAKASFTYAGGIDYLAWKINRHAGTDHKIKDWQRRHPILGAIVLLPKLLRSGAIR